MGETRVFKREEGATFAGHGGVYDGCLATYQSLFVSDLVDFLFPQKYDAGLDVAGGHGTAGLKLAERIGPEGSVTIIDTSPAMITLAQKNAASRGLANVHARMMDAARLEFADNSFDVITCSFGVTSLYDVTRSASEMHRVLKPGGRIGFLVWSIPERFPFLMEYMAAFLKHSGSLPHRFLLRFSCFRSSALRRIDITRGPISPFPFRFCMEGSLERHLAAAGLCSIRRERCTHSLDFENFDEYWEIIKEVRLGQKANARSGEDVPGAVRADLLQRLIQPRTGEVHLRNEAAIILAAKPRKGEILAEPEAK